MKIHSEQEMLDFGENFATRLAPAGGAAWGTPSRAPARMGEDAATGPAGRRSDRQDPPRNIIELIGDVGTGKTTFTRGLARGLGITSPVTSPSFTISKSYAIPDGRTLIHYDFYRLPDPGLMQDDLAEAIANPSSIVVIEWANTVHDLLPEDHTAITIKYNDDNTREVTIK